MKLLSRRLFDRSKYTPEGKNQPKQRRAARLHPADVRRILAERKRTTVLDLAETLQCDGSPT